MTNESTLHPEEANEPLLTESTSRWCMFPVQYNSIWEYYKKAEASFWTGIVPLEYVDFKLQACGASDLHVMAVAITSSTHRNTPLFPADGSIMLYVCVDLSSCMLCVTYTLFRYQRRSCLSMARLLKTSASCLPVISCTSIVA